MITKNDFKGLENKLLCLEYIRDDRECLQHGVLNSVTDDEIFFDVDCEKDIQIGYDEIKTVTELN